MGLVVVVVKRDVALLVFADVGGQVALRPNATADGDASANGSNLVKTGEGCMVYVTHGEDCRNVVGKHASMREELACAWRGMEGVGVDLTAVYRTSCGGSTAGNPKRRSAMERSKGRDVVD